MSFTVPGKILEEYTVRNHRLGVVQFGGTSRPISWAWFPTPVSGTTSGYMLASRPNGVPRRKRS
jgi:hypothetical protein